MKRAVVDQAGLRVVIIGIILSLFIGLIFKSQIRASVVKAKLQQSLVRLQKDINIDFESVEVRLSEWGLPRPVIVIRGVRISPLKAACQENQVFIETLSFPLSFNLIFAKEKVISTLHISLMEVRTKNTRMCFSKTPAVEGAVANRVVLAADKPVAASVSADAAKPVSTAAEVKTAAIEKLRNFKSHLNEVKIDRLRVIAVDKMNTAVDFNAVQVSFKYEQNKLNELNVGGQLLAFKEADKSYYLLKSDIKFLVKLEDKANVSAELKGLVMDRPFQLKIRQDLQKNSIQFLGELSGISLKAINYIVKAERPNTEVYDFLTGSSMSGYLTGEYFIDDRHYEIDIKDIKILAGNGVAEINEIFVFGKIDAKAQIRPFDMQLSHIELTKILNHKAFDNIRPSIQNAGSISGLIQFAGADQVKVKALIEKTSFVFSNKGERVFQTFDSFNFHATLDSKKLSLNINEFILDSQKIQGFVKYSHQHESGDKALAVDLEGHLLKPETVKLFTGAESNPEIKLLFATDLKNNLKGSASIDKLNIHQLEMTKFNLDYEKNLLLKSEIYNLKTAGLTVKESNVAQTKHLNVLFEKIFPKPAVSFNQSRMVIQKDGLGKISFNIRADHKNKPEFNLSGEYIPSGKQLMAKGAFKNSGFTLTGAMDVLVVTPNK